MIPSQAIGGAGELVIAGLLESNDLALQGQERIEKGAVNRVVHITAVQLYNLKRFAVGDGSRGLLTHRLGNLGSSLCLRVVLGCISQRIGWRLAGSRPQTGHCSLGGRWRFPIAGKRFGGWRTK